MGTNDVIATCWSDDYLLSHCEHYRVADETGAHLGFVDRVIWSSEPFGEAEALVVRLSERQQLITIPLQRVKAVKPWSEMIVVSPPFALRRPPKPSGRASTTQADEPVGENPEQQPRVEELRYGLAAGARTANG